MVWCNRKVALHLGLQFSEDRRTDARMDDDGHDKRRPTTDDRRRTDDGRTDGRTDEWRPTTTDDDGRRRWRQTRHTATTDGGRYSHQNYSFPFGEPLLDAHSCLEESLEAYNASFLCRCLFRYQNNMLSSL